MKKQLKVVYTNYGLGNFYSDNNESYIEINKRLKYNKPLRDFVIKHELGHRKEFDFNHEVKDSIKLIKKPNLSISLIAFCIANPSTLVDLLPIQIRNKQIVYDLNLLILYLITISISIFAIKMFF